MSGVLIQIAKSHRREIEPVVTVQAAVVATPARNTVSGHEARSS